MPCICYRKKTFRAESQAIVDAANEIIAFYTEEGYRLTLRQLYYQFVARGLISNTEKSYGKIGSVVNEARLAGLIDWDEIEDRTRNLKSISHWKNPSNIIEVAANQFRIDKWAEQDYRVEVWVEKEALAGIVESVCEGLDVAFFSCRGYVSQSEMWVASQRLEQYYGEGQTPVIIHLGDHDPSGIDMTRDIDARLELFIGSTVTVNRIALNFDQIKAFNPPPNPAKVTDTRFQSYRLKYGDESWELDALEPRVLSDLIEKTILSYRDEEKWTDQVKKENEYRAQLQKMADEYVDE